MEENILNNKVGKQKIKVIIWKWYIKQNHTNLFNCFIFQLRSNYYNIKLTILKWHLVHSQCCATTVSRSKTFLSPPEKILYLWSGSCQFPPLPCSWVCIPSLGIFLSRIFHINGITQYVTSCVCLLSFIKCLEVHSLCSIYQCFILFMAK